MKTIITVGTFDCFNTKHAYLAKELHKLAIPDGKPMAFMFDDYAWFLRRKAFPRQNFDHRRNNLQYFIGDVVPLTIGDLVPQMETMIADNFFGDSRITVAMLQSDDLELSPIEKLWLRSQKIPIRYIKDPRV